MKIRGSDGLTRALKKDDEQLLGAYVQDRILANLLENHLHKLASPGGLLLDVGAGDKIYSPLYDVRFREAYAIDVPWSHHNVKVDCFASALGLPFKSTTFDVVLCTEVLEHIQRPEQALDEMRRVLRPGGKLLLSVPFMQAEHEQPYDYYRYTRYGLEYLLRQSGFSKYQVIPIGEFFSTTHLFATKPLYKLCSWVGRRIGLRWFTSRWNPLLFLSIVVPGWLLVAFFKLARIHASWDKIYRKLSYQPLGYFAVCER